MADRVARVGGTIVVEAREVLRELAGAQFDAALATLPPALEAEYREITPLSWFPVDRLEQVVRAIARQLHTDPLDLNDRVSTLATERALGGIWRMLLRITTDRALLSRTPVIYQKTYDTGRIVPRITAPGRAEVELLDFPGAPEFVLRPLGVGIQTTLRCAGRAQARVTHERTRDGAMYRGVWVAARFRSA